MLFVGLGNPGEEYASTRHNFGIQTLRAWVKEMEPKVMVSVWQEDRQFKADVCEVRNEFASVSCMFPLTYMNESGFAVAPYVNFYKLSLASVLIIHDDMELSLGEVRLILSGSAKGHNGVRSVQNGLGTLEVPRLRLGIGRPASNLPPDKFVLSSFAHEEITALEARQKEVFAILDKIFAEGKITEVA